MFVITAYNGKMPAAMLAVAGDGPNGVQYLRTDAAASWRNALALGMPDHCLRSGYRTLAQQAAQDPRYAVPPGESQHGEGDAADVDEPARSWLLQYGKYLGWLANLVPGEPWHFQYDPTQDTGKIPAPTQRKKKVDIFNDASGSMMIVVCGDKGWQIETADTAARLTAKYGGSVPLDHVTFNRVCDAYSIAHS